MSASCTTECNEDIELFLKSSVILVNHGMQVDDTGIYFCIVVLEWLKAGISTKITLRPKGFQ